MSSAESHLPAINLRGRSSYSNMQSAMSAKKMPAYALRALQPAIGLIDRKSLAGALEFANAARKEGVQPIIGCDFERSEEHTSELQSLMRISYAVFCLKKKTKKHEHMNKSEHTNSINI